MAALVANRILVLHDHRGCGGPATPGRTRVSIADWPGTDGGSGFLVCVARHTYVGAHPAGTGLRCADAVCLPATIQVGGLAGAAAFSSGICGWRNRLRDERLRGRRLDRTF